MRDLKYNIFKIGNYEVAVIFNGLISHSQMVPKGMELLSAGFFSFIKGYQSIVRVKVHEDKASSVEKYPRKNDFMILEHTLNKMLF